MRKHSKGFTIIEVVLVLAIAGLILLMLFIAVPAARRAQRDRLRKQDVGIVVAAVKNYMKHNGGRPPKETDSTAVDTSDPDDPYYDADGDGVADNWKSSAHSKDLNPYLAGLSDSGWVTTSVGVTKAPAKSKGNYLRMAIGDADIAGHVEVIVGAKCPDEMQGAKGQYLEMILTGIRNDIAVFRFLEAGYYYCQDV